MELASARYEMGPARISQTLFSLKPQAAKAVVDISPPPQLAGLHARIVIWDFALLPVPWQHDDFL